MTQPIPQGYKQTEIGVIPEDWEVCALGDLVSISSGESPSKFTFTQSGLPYFKVEQLNLNSVYADETPYFIVSERSIAALSVIFPKRGASIFSNKIRLLKKNSFFDTNLMALTCSSSLDSYYLYSQLMYVGLDSVADTTSVPQINNKHILPFKISVPPLQEQSAIATALSDVDALITGLESLIAKKQAINIATMQQLLTGKTRLPQFAHHPDGTPKGTQQTELGEIPEDWGVRNLGDLLEYEQPTKYLVSHAKFLNEGSYPVLTAGKSFVLGYTNETNGIFTDLPVIIFDDFTTDSKFVNFPFKAKSSAMKMLKPRNKKTPLSLIYNLLNSVDYLVGDHKRHWIGEFQFLNVAMPSDYEEQTAIAQILSDMDEEIQALETRLNKTKQIKHGMMQVLLTGKVRLV